MLGKAYRKVKYFLDKYERWLSPLAMAVGFVVDGFTLQRIDLWLENLIIMAYLAVAVFCIIYLNTYEKKLFQKRFLAWLNLVLPFVMQFAFGGLFSAFMIFYSRSATLYVSWPFILILFALLLGNEFFRERYRRLYFHLSILYLAFLAYAVFALPLVFDRIGKDVFLASGAVSLLMIALVVSIIYLINSQALRRDKYKLILSVGFIYLLFNILYFTNIIPPIPLSLKAGGVYHNIERAGADYRLLYEEHDPGVFWRETARVFHWLPGERVYVFSSIFAPGDFREEIVHHWYVLKGEPAGWVLEDSLSFPITGGRDNGYRGYSYKSAVGPGQWRVDVATAGGQVLGQIRFEIRERDKELELKEKLFR